MYLVTTIKYKTESFLACVDWEELPLYQDLIINKYLRITKTEANEDTIGDQMFDYMRADRYIRIPQDFITVIKKVELPQNDNTINDILIDLHLNGVKVDLDKGTMEIGKFLELDDTIKYLVDNYGFEVLIDLNKKL